ncbi:RIP metalloprotease RseP [Planctomicrobium sp. SH664]|uniref:RIP metalloprotease RseP n=1 Tax=Planctomicrobium sp. SH664 TaxID=3448125 RepID=UPI003F5B94EB
MELTSCVTLGLLSVASIINIVTVAVGLGLVIFFHELGHFLVAKWCGVYVERFSIGFGQPILSRKWGETEYVLAWLPFGGYVKMLGQDDMDPGQMTDDQVAENPRSYTAKSVPQRMAIISAGVIMNIITGTLFFMLAFSWGVMKVDRVAGVVMPGGPAWKQGLKNGDAIQAINGREVNDFDDILRGTALSRGPITIDGERPDGTEFRMTMTPIKAGIHNIIGVGPSPSLTVANWEKDKDGKPSLPGTAASHADFQPGETIVAIDDVPVETYQDLINQLGTRSSQPVQVKVTEPNSKKERVVTLEPERFLTLGIKTGMGKVAAVRKGSVAEQAGLREGDRFVTINDLDVERDLDPFRLTEVFSESAGKEVQLKVQREVSGGSPEVIALTVVPETANPWSEPPLMEESPISVPSLGLAYHLIPHIFSVEPGGPAATQGIQARDTIVSLKLQLSEGAKKDSINDNKDLTFDLTKKKHNWAHALWTLQEQCRTRKVQMTVKSATNSQERTVDLTPQAAEDWFLPTDRGLVFLRLETKRQAASLPEAFSMGAHSTISSMEDIYLTLRGLITGSISYQGLSGPIGIAKVAYSFASVGLTHFLLFLGLISINLAVINFLPIPVLDGGHMVFLLWEGLTRKKPSEKVVATATYFGLAFVLGLMMFVIWVDLFVERS